MLIFTFVLLFKVHSSGSGKDTQLRVSLESLLSVDQVGRWWIVGSSWSGAPMISDTKSQAQQKLHVGKVNPNYKSKCLWSSEDFWYVSLSSFQSPPKKPSGALVRPSFWTVNSALSFFLNIVLISFKRAVTTNMV